MPCKSVTVPGTGESSISVTDISVASSDTIDVTATVSNEGNIQGSSTLQWTADVGNEGSIDATRTTEVNLNAGESKEVTTSFSIEVPQQMDVKFCVEAL